ECTCTSFATRAPSDPVPLHQEHTRRRAATTGEDGRLGVAHLALAGFVPKLRDRLVDEAVAVSATFGQLTAVGVHRQIAVERDALPALEPVLRLADPAEPESFEPRDGIEGEAVVEERQVDVVRPETRARPQVRALPEH